MSLLTRLFGKPDKEIKELTTESDKEKDPAKPEPTGTVLRSPVDATRITQKKPTPELTALELAEQQDWEIKTLPVWQPGDVILDTYEVEDVISGGMGHVYIANHKNWNVKLAIKSPNEMMLSDKDFFARILREANSWTELGLHPNIAYCYYVRNIQDVPHIIVEYVDGGNLRQWIEDGKCIDYRVNLDLAIQFCHGMEQAHSKGMIHRDIKPENVLMTEDGILKITDFGLVRGAGEGHTQGSVDQGESVQQAGNGLTAVGTLMGTAGYMAPEQAESAGDVDERADIFSFGVCLYEMFCGNKPYDITYGPRQEAPSPNGLSRDEKFPDEIGSVLAKSVQWKPENRYANFKEIRQELSTIYKHLFSEESLYGELELLDLESDGFNNRGVAYFELGRKEDAINCWEKSIELNQIHPEATYNLSLIQWRDKNITDDEVLKRLDNCDNNPSADIEKIAELKAYIHVERYDPAAAREVLKNYSGKYEDMFPRQIEGSIKCVHTMKGHASTVETLSLTPDSRFAISGSFDNTLRFWDFETGDCLRTLEGHTDCVNAVALTSDKRYAVSGSKDHTLRMWDLESGHCIHTMEGHAHRVTSVCLTQDDRYAVSGSVDNTLRMWKLESGECIRTMEGRNETVALTSDGRYAVSGSMGLQLWDLETGQCLHTMEGHNGKVRSVCLTPDGRFAVSGSDDETIRLWDLETGRCLRTLMGHTYFVKFVCLTSDGRYVISGSWDKTLRKWDFETGQCLLTMKGHTGTVNSICLSQDGRYAVSSSTDKTLRLWDLESGQCLRTMEGHTSGIDSVNFTPDGCFLVSASQDKTLRLWNFDIEGYYQSKFMVSVPKGFEQRREEEGIRSEAIRAAEELYSKGDYKKSCAILFNAWKEYGFASEEEINKLYSKLMEKGKIKGLTFSYQKKFIVGQAKKYRSVAITPDGRYAVSGSTDLQLWDLENGQCLRTLKGHSKGVSALFLTPNGRYAVTGGHDRTIRLWDVGTGKCLRTLVGHTEPVLSVSLAPGSWYAVSGSMDKTLRFWDLETGQCIRTIEEHTDRVEAVAFTVDDRHAVSGSWDKTIRLWDLETGQCLRTMEGHTHWVTSVCPTADGRYAISGSQDNTLRMWDLQTGKCLRTMEGHAFAVETVSVTADGRYAVSGSNDETVRLWDLGTGRCISILEGHTGYIFSVSLSPDGRYAVSAGNDEAIRMWEFIWNLEFD